LNHLEIQALIRVSFAAHGNGSQRPSPQGGRALMSLHSAYGFDISVIVVSFNTRDLLWKCLQSLLAECERLPIGLTAEVLVVDNASSDGSADMVASEFSACSVPVRLFRNSLNLGFGVANNLALESAQGRYPILLNSDAFLHPGALARAIKHMDADPAAGIGGARLVGSDGQWQPSARQFPSIARDAMVLTGLSSRFARSRVFGAPDRSWADPGEPATVDWVPGAFMILRREALAATGFFDPAFFLYFEEVDLCRRMKAAGFRVQYWPDIVVTHLGGASGRQLKSLTFSETGAQVVLWRMRSTLLYYRKHHGWQAQLARRLEECIYTLRRWRNQLSIDRARRERAKEFRLLLNLMRRAWKETDGGRISPPQPW
jgi:hypothetical protein